jgi:hypothetical protein
MICPVGRLYLWEEVTRRREGDGIGESYDGPKGKFPVTPVRKALFPVEF